MHLLTIAVSSRLTRGGLAWVIVFLGGVAGYMAIEGWSPFDAVYMTVVTMTTVGYEEVRPLSPAGRIFNLLVMVGGVGIMLYILTVTVQSVVEDEIFGGFVRRRRMKAKIDALEHHFILCGYGRVGREVAAAFQGEDAALIVVDSDEDAVAAAEAAGLLAVRGDATHNETLYLSGIERARGLIAASGNDGDNVLITLTANAINPGLNIVARADAAETGEKLAIAGADRVVTPYRIGGRRMALSAIRPMAVDFFDDVVDRSRAGSRIAEIEVLGNSPLSGATVDGFASANQVRVLAVSKPSGRLLVTPDGGTVMEPGDRVILVGPDARLDRLEGME